MFQIVKSSKDGNGPASKVQAQVAARGLVFVSFVKYLNLKKVNRILYVRNLPYKITTEEIYDIFGKFGALRQVRLGINPDTKGTAYVVYEVQTIILLRFTLNFRTFTTRRTRAII